jgi:hypothetical protein
MALVGLTAITASAATVSGEWSMDLSGGSSVDNKAGGGDLDFVGDVKSVPGAVGGAVRFDYSSGAEFATTHSNNDFNPASASFAVGAYLKADSVPTWGDYSPNIVQKGFYGSTGQWKMQLKPTSSGTLAECRFAGSSMPNGDLVADHSKTALNDGRWHEVVCWRQDGTYGVRVDGVDMVSSGNIGDISNSSSLRIGNKGPWAGVEDQFQGTLDCVAYVEGDNALAAAESRVPC